MHILVVEDDKDLASELGDYFRRRQHRVTTCHSLAEARVVLDDAAGEDAPAAIVCDANLPDGNGVDFFSQTSPKHPGRWILLSGAHDHERVAALGDAAAAPNVAVVDKPVSLRDLARLLGGT